MEIVVNNANIDNYIGLICVTSILERVLPHHIKDVWYEVHVLSKSVVIPYNYSI